MTRIIGLTGGIATGKSTVSNILRENGIPIIDADQLTRRLQQPGSVGLKRLAAEFGQQVVQPDGQLDRQRLGQRVFSDPSSRRKLDQVMQPLIREAVADQLAIFKRQQVPAVVLDFPLLFEAHYDQDCDYIIVVAVNRQTQLQRLMARNGYSKQEAEERITAQMPLERKIQRADRVIDNSGSLDSTRKQVAQFINALKSKNLC